MKVTSELLYTNSGTHLYSRHPWDRRSVSDREYHHFRGCYVQISMEFGSEDVSLLERCHVQTSMQLRPEDRCPHFRGCYVHLKMCPY